MNHKNKPRILYVLKLLKNTNESHPISTVQIISALDKLYGIEAHRTTIARDIEDLCEFGYDIVTIHSTQNRYYLASSDFEKPELQLLINAVESSKLITKQKSKTLINKIYALTNPHDAKKLKSFHDLNTRVKPYNENIYYIADKINEAIKNHHKISFTYFQYSARKEIKLKNDGHPYIVSPYDMSWVGDYFYMFGYSEKHNKIVTFRVDRIYNIPKILNEVARPIPKDYNSDEFIKEAFHVYEGQKVKVQLKFSNKIMNVIIDNFGKDVKMIALNDETTTIEEKVMLSPTFYGWVFCLGEDIEIIAPKIARDEYHAMLAKQIKKYH